MTRDHDFKRLVRERARDTGETYMQARAHLLEASAEVEQAERVAIGDAAYEERIAAAADARPDERAAATDRSVDLAERHTAVEGGHPCLLHPEQTRRRLVLVGRGHVEVSALRGRPDRAGNQLIAAGVVNRSRPPVELDITDEEIFMEVDHHIAVEIVDEFDLVIDANGRVTVRGATGVVDAITRSGHISIEGGPSAVAAETGSGRIDVRGAWGTCLAITRSGAITVEGELTDVDLETGSGHISASTVESGRIATNSGHIEVTVGGPGTNVDVAAREVTSDATFLGRVGDWSALLGVDTGRSLLIETKHKVTVHDRTD